jgi:peptide/nickel transport system substrate-binding protein
MPRHYLSRFFPKYNPNAEKEAKAEGFSSWWDKREQETSIWHPNRFFAGKPVLAAWLFTNPPPAKVDISTSQSTIFRAVRNPYYWKIDPAGQQLPYIDQVEFLAVNKPDDVIAMALAGEIDMQYFYLSGEEHRKSFESMANQGKCRLFQRPLSISSASAISLNLTHKDPELRRLFSQRNFREALSLAINRKQLIDTIGLGMIEPYQVAPRPESPFYHEKLARQYTEYNPTRARELLAAISECNQFDSNKFRLREDGKRLAICLSISENPYYNRLWQEVAKGIAKYWQDIGIEVAVESLPMKEFYNKKNKNNHDAVIWEGEGGLDPILEARYYLPISWESNYGVEWYEWRNHRSQYPAPPPAVLKQFDLYAKFKQQTTLERQKEMMGQILDIAADQFYAIGIALQAPSFGFVHARFNNVPKIIPGAWSFPSPGPALPCQYFVQSIQSEASTK